MDVNDLFHGDLTERSIRQRAHAFLDGLVQQRPVSVSAGDEQTNPLP